MPDAMFSALAAITTLADTDEIPVASAGASKKITGANLRSSLLTHDEAVLGADVTMVNADTFYDGPSLSLAAATWLIFWKAIVKPVVNTSQSYWWPARLWDGTNIFDESEIGDHATANFNGWSYPLSGFAIVTLGSPTAVKLSVACGRGSSASKISRDLVDDSGSSHTATRLDAIRIG